MSCLYAKLHDEKGREIELNDLTEDGLHDAKYQCQRLIEEIETEQSQRQDADAE